MYNQERNKITDINDLSSLLCPEWRDVIGKEFKESYWDNIIKVLNKEYDRYLPKKSDIFNALNECKPDKVKVVIIGQDPYINDNQAHGFAFSVNKNTIIPPSLKNIFKEIQREYNINTELSNGCLIDWAREGVLLLNSILTVRIHESNSHKNIGWERFTSSVIKYIDENKTVVFLAWGSSAIRICKDNVTYNTVLTAGHPSPVNRTNPFYGCGCFKEANEILMKHNILPVRWIRLWNNTKVVI